MKARAALQSRAGTHGKPLHLARPGHRRARAAAAPVSLAAPYEAGHFTELIRRHDWPPRWQAQYQRTREVEQSEICRANRERQVALGNTGTIVGLSLKSDAALLARQVVMSAKARR